MPFLTRWRPSMKTAVTLVTGGLILHVMNLMAGPLDKKDGALYRFDTDGRRLTAGCGELAIRGLPSKREMSVMSIADQEDLYQSYFNTLQTLCGRPERLGNRKDGGWDICADDMFIHRNKCIVYSFGIYNDFSFDDDIGNRFGCEVHSFDPSMKTKDHVRSQRPLVIFHAVGISHVNRHGDGIRVWPMLTYQSIRETLNHTEIIPAVVKMDIENAEWDVLDDILTSQERLPRQLVLEFHSYAHDLERDDQYWLKRLYLLRDVYDKGYRIFWINRNLACVLLSTKTTKLYYGCLEVSFICPTCI